MTIDLRTCQVGQKAERRDGVIVRYELKDEKDRNFPHKVSGYWYTNGGYFSLYGYEDLRDIVRILPLEPANNKHPSVAAWESFPWITDRVPTRADTTQQGWLATTVLTFDSIGLQFRHCNEIELGTRWIHLPNWTPPNLTPQEEALALLEGKDDNWVPSAEEWLVFRKAIKP